MSHSLKGSFSYPREPPIISIIPKRKHFQWNSAIKKLCSHVNCFLYLAKQKKAGLTFFRLLVRLLPPLDPDGNNAHKGEVKTEENTVHKISEEFNHQIIQMYSNFFLICLDE